MNLFKKLKRAVGGGAKKGRKALDSRTPLYGPKRTLGGTKLTPKQVKAREKLRRTDTKKNKRIVRKTWRRLV